MKTEFNYQNKVLTLPGSVLEKIATASDSDLRVLLVLAGRADLQESFDAAKLGVALNLSEKEVELSIAFWRGAGILKTGRTAKKGALPPEKAKEEGNTTASEGSGPLVFSPQSCPTYTGKELEKLMEERQMLRRLLKECQNLLGKVFNVAESNKLVALVDYLHLPEDYILLLCSYCKSKDKGSIAYVSTTAYELFYADIVTLQALEEYIAGRERQQDFENFLRHLLGIGGRKLTPREKRFFESWRAMGLPNEVVSCGYEASVDATGELSLPHINRVLLSLQTAGAQNRAEAEQCIATHREEMKKLYGSKTPPSKESKDQNEFKSFDTEDFFNAAKKKGKNSLFAGKE